MPNISFDIRDSVSQDLSPDIQVKMRELCGCFGLEFNLQETQTCIHIGRFQITCENGDIRLWKMDVNGGARFIARLGELVLPAR